MLGMAKDSRDLLQKAADYLDERGSYHELRLSKKNTHESITQKKGEVK
jgi:hypothetical protein